MLAEERRFRIREILSNQRSVAAAVLKDTLGVTAATIRRDLAALEDEGVLIRSHGGAVSRTSSTDFQLSYEALLRTNHDQKVAIAQEAEKLILDGETVFLEGSSTVLELARFLQNRSRLTVVTNSPPVVAMLHNKPGITLMCTGGDVLRDTFYLAGIWTERVLNEIRVDKAFMGVTTLDPCYGVSAARQAEAQVKKLLVKAARIRIALADHSKFGRQSFAFVGPISDISVLVTDSGTDPSYIHDIEQAGIQVLIATVRSAQSTHIRSQANTHSRK
jgi:DeoR family fructose operon transcriptional repressor